MNGFQKGVVKRAIKQPHRLDEYENNFIKKINLTYQDLDLTTNQNKKLNEICGKLR